MRRHLTVLQALAVLEAATLDCRETNINTPAVRIALSVLERRIRPQWLIPQFRYHLQSAAEEVEKKAQDQAILVTFLHIRETVTQLVRQRLDSLALKFHYTPNPMIKQEINLLGRELLKLDKPPEFPDKSKT
ncbi:MAG: hypothetical protein ABW172_02065 [Candidatus Binatia bacterium]